MISRHTDIYCSTLENQELVEANLHQEYEKHLLALYNVFWSRRLTFHFTVLICNSDSERNYLKLDFIRQKHGERGMMLESHYVVEQWRCLLDVLPMTNIWLYLILLITRSGYSAPAQSNHWYDGEAVSCSSPSRGTTRLDWVGGIIFLLLLCYSYKQLN